MKILKDYWLPILILLALAAGALWLFSRPEVPPLLAPKVEKAIKAGIQHDQKQVGRDTTRARDAAASGATNYEAGKAYATVAKTIHQQAKAHAKPTVSSDTAAERLQRALANY